MTDAMRHAFRVLCAAAVLAVVGFVMPGGVAAGAARGGLLALAAIFGIIGLIQLATSLKSDDRSAD